MDQNIKLYPWFRAAADTHAWIPIFFLYFSQFVSFKEVIQLSAVYYISVFSLEVPSGYFSDRVGRRTTLIIAAAAAIGAHLIFLVSDSFIFFALAQFLLAVSIAFQSGTDTALHYDSLVLADKSTEYEQREAHAEKIGRIFLAISTLLGGTLGSVDMRFAYLLSLSGAMATLILVVQLSEPIANIPYSTKSFMMTIIYCIKRLQHPLLLWLFTVLVIMYAMAHVPFEFYQPYIQLLDIDRLFGIDINTTLISGLVISVSMFGGAVGASLSVRLRSLLGLFGLIGVAVVVQIAIIIALGTILHVVVLIMIFIRSFPMSILHAPVNAVIVPLISSKQRATYLSLQSLSQRIFFTGLLLLLSTTVSETQNMDWVTLSSLLKICLGIGVAGLIPLIITYARIKKFIERCNVDGRDK